MANPVLLGTNSGAEHDEINTKYSFIPDIAGLLKNGRKWRIKVNGGHKRLRLGTSHGLFPSWVSGREEGFGLPELLFHASAGHGKPSVVALQGLDVLLEPFRPVRLLFHVPEE